MHRKNERGVIYRIVRITGSKSKSPLDNLTEAVVNRYRTLRIGRLRTI